jgi:outer membrane protein assembly factor BamB
MHTSATSTLLALLSIAAAGTALADDWPQWRGPNRDGQSAEKGIIKSWEDSPPELLWMVEGMGRGYSSVSVAKGKIYTTGNFDGGQGVIAARVKDGEVLWRKKLTDSVPNHGSGGARSMPAVDGDLLFVTTSNGTIACLTTAGNVKWQKDFKEEWDGKMMSGWGFSESPLVDGDVVVCTPGGPKAIMVALDKKTGRTKWECEMPDIGSRGRDGAGYGSIVISNAAGVKQYVQMVGRGVIGVRAKDGGFLWGYNKVANGTANIPTPVVAGEHIFCSSGYGTGSALLRLKKNGDAGVEVEEVYFLKSKSLQNHHGGMILHNGYIFCGHGHNDGKPICLDVESGEASWGPEKGAGHGSAGLIYVDGHIIYRWQSGHLGLVEASEGGYKLKGSFMPKHQEKESWAHPVISGGKLYLREQDKLMCYGL